MGRNYGNELILAAGTGRIGITLIIDASNITVEPTKSTWMPTAVGARSLRCRAITAADTDSDIRANPDQRRSRPDTQRMILESFGELDDKRPGPRGHKAGGAAVGGATQPALCSWMAFLTAAVTICKTNLKIKFRFSMDSLEDHDEHAYTSTIRHNSFRVHVKTRNCGDAHRRHRGRRIFAL